MTIIRNVGTKEYKCLRKAFLLFLLSFKLNTIREATSIIQQFFYFYPTFVGWFFLATKIKRIMFSFFELDGRQTRFEVEQRLELERSLVINSSPSRDSSSCPSQGSSTAAASTLSSNSEKSTPREEKKHSLRRRESHLRRRITKLKIQDNSRSVGSDLSSNTNSKSNGNGGRQRGSFNEIYQVNTLEESRGEQQQQQRHSSDFNSKENNTKNERVHGNNQREGLGEEYGDFDSWGHFVDCKTMDEDDIIDPLRMILKMDPALFDDDDNDSNDYGHFVDISDDSSNDDSIAVARQSHGLRSGDDCRLRRRV